MPLLVLLSSGCVVPASAAGSPATEASLTAMAGALLTWVIVVLVLAAVAEKAGDAFKISDRLASRGDTLQDLFGYPSFQSLVDQPPGVLASVLRTLQASGPLVIPAGYSAEKLEALLTEIAQAPLVGPTAQSLDMATLLTAGGAPSVQAMQSTVMQASQARDTRATLVWVIAATDGARQGVASKRVLKLRGLSMLCAIALASLCQIDSFELLRPLYAPGALATRLSSWSADTSAWIGVLLTGIAAGAGTPFWHDILDSVGKSRSKVEALTQRPATATPSVPEL